MTIAQAVDIPPVWLLGGIVLVWVWTLFAPGLTAPIGPGRVLGLLSAVAGIGLMVWAVQAFRRHQTSVVPHQVPRNLIRSGPYQWSRNPIYVGDVLVLLGAILWWGAWPALALIPLFIQILTRRFIAPEEARMKESFGADFDDFAEQTPRWL